MIGYQQSDLSTNRIVYVSCLWLNSVLGQFNAKPVLVDGTRHVRAAVAHFAELNYFFFHETHNHVQFLSQILS